MTPPGPCQTRGSSRSGREDRYRDWVGLILGSSERPSHLAIKTKVLTGPKYLKESHLLEDAVRGKVGLVQCKSLLPSPQSNLLHSARTRTWSTEVG